jgi:Kef-type K+ transport system membrane component KefB/voltage-gated potassium channel Kch
MLFPLIVMDRPWQAALVAGLGLALSSTAMVMQMIAERGGFRHPYGQKSFAILLMQDLAIVPLLALVAFLAPQEAEHAKPLWRAVLDAVVGVAVVILIGRYLLDRMFRVLARHGGEEIMTAATLLVVIAAGTIMVLAGLSMAMGAFVAGVLLADSIYRHELEADIEPFRGLLLGLFFLSVGMSIDAGVILANWPLILGGVLTVIVFKSVAIYALVRLFGETHATAVKTGLLLSQGCDFGFVLFAAAAAQGVIAPDEADLLIAGITLSMLTTPLLVRWLPPLLVRETAAAEPDEDFDGARGTILVIGFGRFGQLASQLFIAAGHELVLLDNDVQRVEEARRFGSRVYFGDGRRLDVLRSADAAHVSLIAVCTDDRDVTNAIVDLVRAQFPGKPLFVRAYDRRHSLVLLDKNVTFQRRETMDSAITFAREALIALGDEEEWARDIEAHVRRRDEDRLRYQHIEGSLDKGDAKWREVTPEPLTLRRPQTTMRADPEPLPASPPQGEEAAKNGREAAETSEAAADR